MKKLYFSLLVAVLSVLSFSTAHAQFFADSAGNLHVYHMPIMNHDSTSCSSSCMVQYTITVDSSFLGDTVRIVDTMFGSLLFQQGNTTGASPWTVTAVIPVSYGNTSDEYLSGPGPVFFHSDVTKVTSTHDTIHYITHNYTLLVTNPCTYGSVSGQAYIDNNADCTFNTGDVALNGMNVSIQSNLTSPGISNQYVTAYSGFSGNYSRLVQQSWMTNYTVSLPPAYYFIFPITPCFSGSYGFTTLPQTNVDFPLQCSNSIDVSCWAGSPASVRLHTPFYMQPYVNNMGCDSATGVLTFIKDSRVTYTAGLSFNPAITVSGDTLTWNYVNLTNLTNGAYWNSFMSQIYLEADTSVAVGDTLCFRIYTTMSSSDISLANNDYTICLPVVYSYDPNLKEVSPKGTGAEGFIPASTPTLTYTLHFQNTGTAAAYNIAVIDTLDADVDPTTLHIQGTSHNMNPEWLAPNVVKFYFPNIMLPDSTGNEALSHGYVRFTVNPRAGLTPGTQIKNKGYIYFDANPPVITNTALNTIAGPTAITNATGQSNVKIYPNPATANIFVENLQDGNISILSMNGSIVLNQNIVNNKTEINIDRLPAGIYILKTVSKDGATTRKFVKQ